ncbi:MAG: hypothetical protein H6699_02300 [Myxococcales bacterium]|nr:hypothetical protein [Myxococcales bacterium]
MKLSLRAVSVLAFVALSAACGGGGEDEKDCSTPCTTPPSAVCTDGTLTTYNSIGVCVEGTCQYEPTSTGCSGGQVCGEGACVDPPDICDGVTCTDPPAATCDGDSVVSFASPGSCSGESGTATCDYEMSTSACRSNQVCVDGECVRDLCAGVDCNEPPAAACEGNVIVSYEASGTCDAATGDCSYTEASRRDCAAAGLFCEGGTCVEADPCEGITCDAPPEAVCNGSVLTQYANRGLCSDGECAYSQTERDCELLGQLCRDATCRDRMPCEDIVCDRPPRAACAGDVLTTFDAEGTCELDACTYTPHVTNCTDLGEICVAGACVAPTPCDGIRCVTPPAAVCEGEVSVTFTNPGTCEDGVCRYDEVREDCAATEGGFCSGGVCETVTDPCSGVVCNVAPPPACDGDIAVTYSLPGACADGTCSYLEDYDDCTEAAGVCTDGACISVDPCDGVVCDAPPAPTCEGEVAVSASTGVCVAGACDYTVGETRTDCALAGKTCVEAVCVGAGALLRESDLYISEMMLNPPGGAAGAVWFEIASNFSDTSLEGLTISNGRRSFEIPAGVEVGLTDHIIVGGSEGAVPTGVDVVFPSGFTLAPGDTITLTGSEVVDTVATSTDGSWPFAAGVALQLAYGSTDGDNDSPTSWCPATETYESGAFGSPGMPNSLCASPVAVDDLFVTELMLQGARVVGSDQWIELWNQSSNSIDLYGLRVTTSTSLWVVDHSVIVAAGEYAVIGVDSFSGGGADVWHAGALPLDPVGDVLTISLGPTVLDTLDFSAGSSTWPYAPGVAMQLSATVDTAAANDSASTWCPATATYTTTPQNLGTPGAANFVCSAGT